MFQFSPFNDFQGLTGCLKNGVHSRYTPEFFQADEPGVRPLLTDDVRSGNVVCYLIGPGPQRTALAEVCEAAPEGQVYLLEKVLAPVRIRFKGSS